MELGYQIIASVATFTFEILKLIFLNPVVGPLAALSLLASWADSR